MADLTKTIKILFSGDDQISGTVNTLSGNLSNLSDVAQDAAAPWAGVADNILKVSAALAALAAGGVAVSVLKFQEFEDVMLKVKGVLGASEADYQALNDVTRELGATTRYTATEAAQGLEFLALAGFNTTEAISAIPEVLQLAQAAAIDLGAAADIVTNIMAGYGVEVEKLGNANDVLTATFTNSNTNLEQLGAAFKFVGPVAAGLGLELSETAAILGTLGNAGYQAEMGGTALRNILIALVAPAGNMGKLMKELGVDTEELGVDLADAKNALRSLGVEVKDSDGNLRPFADILDDIKAGLEQIPDPADRTATLIEIFGKRGGPQLAALLAQGSDSIRDLETKINSLGGVTGEIAAEMESGIGGALRNFKSALEAIALEIGGSMSPAIAGVIDGGTEVERAFAQLLKDGTFDPVFDRIDDFAGSLANVLSEIAKNMPEAFENIDFDNLLSAFDGLGNSMKAAFEAVFGEVDLSTVDGLETAIQRSVDAITGLINITSGIVDGMRPIFETIGFGVDQFENLDEEGARLAGTFLGIAKDVMFFTQHLDLLKIALISLSGATMINAAANIAALGTSAAAAVTGVSGLTGALAILMANPFFQATVAYGIGYWVGDQIRDLSPNVDLLAQKFFRLTDRVINFTGQRGNVDLEPNLNTIGDTANNVANDVLKIPASLNEIPDEKQSTITMDGIEYSIEQFKLLHAQMLMQKDIQKTKVEIEVDTAPAIQDMNVFKYQLEDGTWAEIDLNVDQGSIDKAAKDITDKIDPLKRLEIQTEFDIAKLETAAGMFSDIISTINTEIEWSAKVDIAQIEADAETTIAAFDSIEGSISSVSSAAASMFSDLAGMEDMHWSDPLFNVLTDQMNMQRDLVDAQVDLINQQIENMKKGEAVFTISGENVSQGARTFMMEVLKEIQVEMNASASSYLMGATP